MGSARALLAGSSASGIDDILSWQCAILFAFFVVITVIWEFGTALMAWITISLSGRKALWLQRLKAEILALGIITLVLSVLTTSLASICVDGEPPNPDESPCPEGQVQLFSAHLIHYTHLLLFGTAVMHIVVTCSSFYMSLARMGLWKEWEKNARHGTSPELQPMSLMKLVGRHPFEHFLRSAWGSVVGVICEPMYCLLRILFKVRIDAAVAADPENHISHINFLNVVEQAMEVDFTNNNGLSIVMFFFMAIFLAIPRSAHGIYALALLSILTMFAVSAKVQSIVIQLSASAYFDCQNEIRLVQFNRAHALERIKTMSTTGFYAPSQTGRKSNKMLQSMKNNNATATRGTLIKSRKWEAQPMLSLGPSALLPSPSGLLPPPRWQAGHPPSSSGNVASPTAPLSPLPYPGSAEGGGSMAAALGPQAGGGALQGEASGFSVAAGPSGHSLQAPGPTPSTWPPAAAGPSASAPAWLRPDAPNDRQQTASGWGPTAPVVSAVGNALAAGSGAEARHQSGEANAGDAAAGKAGFLDIGGKAGDDGHHPPGGPVGEATEEKDEQQQHPLAPPAPLDLSRLSGVVQQHGSNGQGAGQQGQGMGQQGTGQQGQGAGKQGGFASPSLTPSSVASPFWEDSQQQAGYSSARFAPRTQMSAASVAPRPSSQLSRPPLQVTPMVQSIRGSAGFAGFGSSTRVAPEPFPALRLGTPQGQGPATPSAFNRILGGVEASGMSRLSAVTATSVGDPDWLLPIPDEVEAYRSRTQVKFRDPLSPKEGIRKDCRELFPFNSPAFLCLVFEFAFLETSLALTLLIYGLIVEGSSFASEEGPGLVAVCIIMCVLVLIYASINVQPMMALVRTVGTSNPARLLREIKAQKLVEAEEYEEGFGGRMLQLCFGVKDEGEEQEGTLDGTHNSFILMLADQAGVIAAGKATTTGVSKTLELHKRFAEMWLQRTMDWRRSGPGGGPYQLVCDLDAVRNAFHLIDKNHSGAIGTSELASVLKAMGTRATALELEDMVEEIDTDGTKSIDLMEFCFFLVFKFLDSDNDGYITRDDLIVSMKTLELDEEPEMMAVQQAERMMDYLIHRRATNSKTKQSQIRRIRLAEFIHIFGLDTHLCDEAQGFTYSRALPVDHTAADRSVSHHVAELMHDSYLHTAGRSRSGGGAHGQLHA